MRRRPHRARLGRHRRSQRIDAPLGAGADRVLGAAAELNKQRCAAPRRHRIRQSHERGVVLGRRFAAESPYRSQAGA